VQAPIQALGMIVGFIFVRALDKQDYALFIMVMGSSSVFLALTNFGLTDTVAAIGGRAWRDRDHLGRAIASAYAVRKLLLLAVLVPLTAIHVWLLMRIGAGFADAVLYLCAAWIIADRQFSTEIMSVALRLRSQILDVQLIELASIGLRGTLAVGLLLALGARSAVLIVLAGAVLSAALTRRRARPIAELKATSDAEMEARLRTTVARRWPYDVLAIASGHATQSLLAILGGAVPVADLGALGRFAVIFAICEAAVRSTALPRFARSERPQELRAIYLVTLGGSAVAAVLPVMLAWAMPGPFLWLLGQGYRELSRELVLFMASAATGFVGNTVWGLNSVRAWVAPAWIMIVADIGTYLVLIAVIGVATLPQLLTINILVHIVFTIVSIATTMVFSKGLSRP
jgi:hypothetical protein